MHHSHAVHVLVRITDYLGLFPSIWSLILDNPTLEKPSMCVLKTKSGQESELDPEYGGYYPD